MMASVTQPPDVVGADEEAVLRRYRELSGLSEEQVNPITTDYFLLLASATVFVSVIEQLAALANGDAGDRRRTCRPPSPACTTCFYRALKRHKAAPEVHQ